VSHPVVTEIRPTRAIEGGQVTLIGDDLPVDLPGLPDVQVRDVPARVVFASRKRLRIVVPAGIGGGGPVPVRVGGGTTVGPVLNVASPLAGELHQVDSPAIDRAGNVYLTYSGTRGEQMQASIFRVAPDGARETFSTSVVNPTSIAIDADGQLFVSSRFEGTVYRLAPDGSAEPFVTDLGVACGLAFAPDGTLFVGDRSGTIFAVDRSGRPRTFASLPPSVAAFHLAQGRDGLYVTAPTLSSSDVVYRIAFDGTVYVHGRRSFGRPQGLAIGDDGSLFVVEALAGASGLYRFTPDGDAELVLAGAGLIGAAFDRRGGLVVCTSDTAYHLPLY
jgi:sugar lactone lactonase YvrE